MVWGWLNWVNGIATLPLAIIAFIFAIQQVVEAKKAAISARESAKASETAAIAAAASSRDHFRQISAALLGPQLMRLEEAFSVAVDKKSEELLSHLTGNWTWQAGMCRHYLDNEIPQEAEIMIKIQSSIVAVKTLKQLIPSFDSTTDWVDKTKRVRKLIGDVTADLGPLAAHQSTKEIK